MAGTRVKFSYKQLHTLKHALGQYMCRPELSEEDYQSEKNLYAKLSEEIEGMKIRHNIRDVKE